MTTLGKENNLVRILRPLCQAALEEWRANIITEACSSYETRCSSNDEKTFGKYKVLGHEILLREILKVLKFMYVFGSNTISFHADSSF